MHFFNRLKSRIISRLARELEIERKQLLGASHCILGVGSVLMPEAEIGNFAGGPERIRIGKNSYIRGRLQTYGHGGQVTIGDLTGDTSTGWKYATFQ